MMKWLQVMVMVLTIALLLLHRAFGSGSICAKSRRMKNLKMSPSWSLGAASRRSSTRCAMSAGGWPPLNYFHNKYKKDPDVKVDNEDIGYHPITKHRSD